MKFLAGVMVFFALVSCQPETTVTIGIITDVHHDIMHDAEHRLARFIDHTNVIGTDFNIQLGDFCRPYDYNQSFLSLFNNHEGDHYHVLGNHDMDGGFTRDSVMAFFGMENNYYSFDQGNFHFVVLDGNDKNPDPNGASGYARFVGAAQLDWLEKDLEKTTLPSIVFSHQGFRGEFEVENAAEVRRVFEQAPSKVWASINGHNHADSTFLINDIYYIEINSASYEWLGGDYLHESYSKEIHEEYPWIAYTSPFQKPVWAILRISSKGKISLEGRDGEWQGPSPAELNHPGRKDGIEPYPGIRSRELIMNY